MRIRLVGHLGESNMKVGSDGPWREFVNELKNRGHEIVDSNYGAKVDALIANSHSKIAVKECENSNVPKHRMFLILWEPKINDYKRHSKKVLNNYGIIWSPSLDWANKFKTRYFNWPQLELNQQFEILDNWNKRQNKAVMILANKFSATKGELYTLRRQLAVRTAKKQTMDLYGAKWNLKKTYSYRHYFGSLVRTPIYLISIKSFRYLGKFQKNYHGLSLDKFVTANAYRIVVVLENSMDYISEKLFDAFASNAIVIYVGPRISRYGIPDAAAIQISPNSNKINKEITELQALPVEKQFEIMQEQQKRILSISKKWYCYDVLKKLAADICEELVE